MPSALSVERLDKCYKRQAALDKISFNIERGECFGLIGLNGAGKTTLLKLLLNLQPPDDGDIRLFSIPQHLPHARSCLAYLPEKFSPPEYMNGWGYLRWIADSHKLVLTAEAFTEKVIELMGQVDLAPAALRKPVKHYSKGMLQKLGIIGCLLSGKELLIMDEPMSGLDPKARACFKNLLLNLKSTGKTLLLCTHILTDIEQLCDRIGILHAGRLIFQGTPQACSRQYREHSLEPAFLRAIETV